MKRFTVLFIAVMLTSFFVPCLSVRAEPSLVPHEDPASVQSVLDSYSFLAEYTDIFVLVASEQYDNATRLSEQLSRMTVPEDLSYVINRYNDLTQQLIEVLSNLDFTLDSASFLLDQYRLDEAGQALDHAGVLVAKAQILLGDLKDATLTTSQRLGVFATSVDSKVQQAYSQLQGILLRLVDLINQYHTLLQRTNQKAEEIKAENLEATALTLALNATKCFVGGYVSVSGVLTSKGKVLENREITVILDGNQSATAKTDSNGSYHTKIRIPYKYVDSVAITTLFTPMGNDRGLYLAASSPTINVQVLFYKLLLNISAPSVGYPGLPLAISGTVTSENKEPLNGKQVKLFLNQTLIAQAKTDQTGTFTSEPTIDAQAELGAHSLTVTVDPEGLYAGAIVEKTLVVQKMSSNLQVDVPSFVMLPSTLQITGKVKSASGTLSGTTVEVEFANVSNTAKTLSDGSFNLTLNVPLNTVFAGYQDFKVSAQPSEPWIAATQKSASTFVLNSVGIVFSLTSALSVGFVMYSRFAKTQDKKNKKAVEEPTAFVMHQKEASAAVAPAVPDRNFEGRKGKVLKAYVNALEIVQSVTGNSLMPNMTLREYLQATSPRLKETAHPFSELTVLTEKSLYSPNAPNEADSEKAEKLANTIRRTLTDGTA
jgi:hypothetical protein